jgi:hypothetical protein
MKKINKYGTLKLLLIVSFLATVFLAIVLLIEDNETITTMHLWAGILFAVLGIIHIVSHSKKHKD